jgi:AcrR family transcriptional regulator
MKIEHVQRTHRPRVEGQRKDEILDAAVTLLMVGYDGLSLDAVAKKARASKATLYRRWESKAHLVLEALARVEASRHIVARDTGSFARTSWIPSAALSA